MKKKDLIIIIPFLMFIFTFGLLYFVIPDIEFSENENKYLQQFPNVTFKNIANGKFEADFEEYLSDQIAGRDLWVAGNSVLLQACGRKDINGVYIGNDGYLLEIFDKLDMDRYSKQIAALNKFVTYVDCPVYFAISPNSVSVMNEKLPKNAVNYSQEKYISEFYSALSSEITTIDLSSVLKAHCDEYIFYRTDHHWTSYGAFLAYNELAEIMGLKILSEEDVSVTEISSDFLGTLFSKGNFIIEPDTMHRYELKNSPEYTVILDDGKELDTLFDESYLSSKDKYAYFSHGNPGHLKVETEADNDKILVIVKDSYMHCMLPLFVDSYSEIHMLDPRYIKTNLTEYITALEPDEILMLYNAQTLSGDVNFTRLGTAPNQE
ncbi:MAG: hypothetical protein IJB97_10005 [Clostridia bacterium]|nr:hypothetical protein [Clostridia bacterium]